MKETIHEELITCPHCGWQDRDSWENHDDDGEVDCGKCEKTFKYQRNVSVTYSTQEIPEKQEGA